MRCLPPIIIQLGAAQRQNKTQGGDSCKTGPKKKKGRLRTCGRRDQGENERQMRIERQRGKGKSPVLFMPPPALVFTAFFPPRAVLHRRSN